MAAYCTRVGGSTRQSRPRVSLYSTFVPSPRTNIIEVSVHTPKSHVEIDEGFRYLVDFWLQANCLGSPAVLLALIQVLVKLQFRSIPPSVITPHTKHAGCSSEHQPRWLLFRNIYAGLIETGSSRIVEKMGRHGSVKKKNEGWVVQRRGVPASTNSDTADWADSTTPDTALGLDLSLVSSAAPRCTDLMLAWTWLNAPARLNMQSLFRSGLKMLGRGRSSRVFARYLTVSLWLWPQRTDHSRGRTSASSEPSANHETPWRYDSLAELPKEPLLAPGRA